jgi:DNA-directed RNA polymerase I subunit RPA2
MTATYSTAISGVHNLSVQLDGRIIGWASTKLCLRLANLLRDWKTSGRENIPLDLEIGYVPPSKGGQYPGLFLFSSRARMMRPVKYLKNGRDDSIGPFEQVYMDIAVDADGVDPQHTTHVEHSPTNFLSILANLTPFSDFNQVSPAYSC